MLITETLARTNKTAICATEYSKALKRFSDSLGHYINNVEQLVYDLPAEQAEILLGGLSKVLEDNEDVIKLLGDYAYSMNNLALFTSLVHDGRSN